MTGERGGDRMSARKQGPTPAYSQWTFLEDEAEKAGMIVRNPAPGAAAPLVAPYIVPKQK
jgi:hypothetical protein